MTAISSWRSHAFLRFSPQLATAVLTAAIFLLPSTGDGKIARAAVDQFEVPATQLVANTLWDKLPARD